MKVLAALLLLAVPVSIHAASTPICTDRPTKANAVCTVPPGKLQVETMLTGWSLTRVGGTRTELVALAPTVVKVGLSSRSDLQIGFTPHVRLTTGGPGSRVRRSGAGDVVARYKHRLTNADAATQVAVIPFAKLPTAASGLGNGKVEGGFAVAVSRPIGAVTVTLGPEIDLLADADGRGRHLALINLVNVSATVAPRLTVAGELWSNLNFEDGGTVRQYSADAALAYALSDDVQVDAGANVGLNRQTPDLEIYAGASFRF